jgi:hypothetical protein
MDEDTEAALVDAIGGHCDEILKLFKPGAEITVVVVNDDYGDAGVIVSNGDLKRAELELMRRDIAKRVRGKKSVAT